MPLRRIDRRASAATADTGRSIFRGRAGASNSSTTWWGAG